MSYFSDHYNDITYPIVDAGTGLYNARVGAIHAIASHFTIESEFSPLYEAGFGTEVVDTGC